MTTTALFPIVSRDEVFRIETRRLWLRWPTKADAVTLTPWVGKPSVALMTSTFSVGMPKADVAARLGKMRAANAAGQSLGFVMTLKGAEATAVGMVGAHGRGHGGDLGDVEVGYHLDPALWGQGLMTEALTAVCAWAFALSDIDAVMAGVKPDNLGSRRVLEKTGFVADGGYEHESPLYGRHAVKRYRLKRTRPSPLLSPLAGEPASGSGARPEMSFDLCGRV